ncbi:RNA-binding protein 208 [Elaeis guineensis]|uniref:Oligouridylate-binding protein 1B isoform X1 n=1 Tax=Elaeis guineensis var. tenera TaxID=51953 RepID=A0A6I9RWK6_ELAGV|nr:oligouridylate-binding protein 1B isoform X1 [Elaeis guineensis]
MNPRLKQQQQQQQALMQQAMLQQQQLYHSGVLAAAVSQMEPVPSGNLPPGFDSSTCRSVYVGNIHPAVTESLLAEVFQGIGPLEGCKLIRKEKSSFGFVDYHDRRAAALAIVSLHGRQIYGQAIKVNWAYASGQREDTSGHFHIFVGDLSPEVTDATLYACFSVYPSCSDARVMWDNKTGHSRGFGFISFRIRQDAQNAINDMTGKWLGNRQIRCNWATKSAGEDKQNNDNQNAVVLTNGNSGNADGGQENANGESPENNPAYTTVYVGNLAHEVTQAELHRQFHFLEAGVIEEVRIQRDKGFGFVRYHTHEQAALAIQMANGRILCGKSMKCSWGTKPTPPGTTSNPLPPPVPPFPMLQTPGLHQGYTAAELLAYQRQLALNQAAAGPLAVQHSLAAQVSGGLLSGGSQATYDGYPSQSSAQQLMYYN